MKANQFRCHECNKVKVKGKYYAYSKDYQGKVCAVCYKVMPIKKKATGRPPLEKGERSVQVATKLSYSDWMCFDSYCKEVESSYSIVIRELIQGFLYEDSKQGLGVQFWSNESK